MFTPESRRADFPSLEGRSYFNTAAEGIPPLSVLHALEQYGQDKLLGMDGRAKHEAVWDRAKQELADAYGLSTDEVSFCSCSSEAFNLAALALQLQPGDEVVINDLDFPAGSTPWLQESSPATVKVWKSRDFALHPDDLKPLLSPRTRLVTTSLVSFFNGFKIDVPEVTRLVRAHSPALFALDVTQGLGRIPLELSDVDLIISSTHKWILASHGGGLVGVPAHRAAEWTVPAGGWFNLQNAFEADRFEKTVTKQGAASFSVGMPNYPAIYAIEAGLSYIRQQSIPKINDYCQPLYDHCFAELNKLDVEMLTPSDPANQAGIMAFRHPDAERIYKHLHAENIHLMYHAGRLRIAIHGYNSEADVERLLAGIHSAVKS
ncbi:Cysteine desulfurase CsdA [Polystyrenella longa]|uniref:Cysteine desulfurase CsdA n=1 Tax=Polystyrenella longa TaxID=2528007 RepID=A0A518CLS3_9PLAN|nr:aminotransferase class V-fold PLP-dependent enzyme [Polystyrenella longa]QDU80175.1 Cysteine desulfurase CsdA [Polystyrenella longa]